MTLVSVIVPVYNVEAYLSTCVESLLAQTHKDLEIVLVNDGSTDESPAMCDAMADLDHRVVVLHKANGGLSDARNVGLASAKGTYVMFLDSDDWIESGAVAKMLDLSDNESAEVVVAGYFVDHEDGMGRLLTSEKRTPRRQSIPPASADNGDRLVTMDLLNYAGYAWNKLYRKSFLDTLDGFPVGVSLVEDIVFNGPALAAASRIVFVDDAFVHYMHRPRSTLGSTHYPDLNRLIALASRSTSPLLKSWGMSEGAGRRVIDAVEQARYRHSLLLACRERRPAAIGGFLRQAIARPNGRKALWAVAREAVGVCWAHMRSRKRSN